MIFCERCGRPNSDPSRKTCPECRKKNNERGRIRRLKRMKAGLCIYCGKEPPRPGTNECKACQIKRQDKAQNRINRGKCVRCGKRPINKERSDSMCTECLDYYAKIMRGR